MSPCVYVFNRGPHPIAIFDADGTYVGTWGKGIFTRPHCILSRPDDAVYCIDDAGHTIRKFTADGRLHARPHST